jgi:predicted nucleic acid-binding protein
MLTTDEVLTEFLAAMSQGGSAVRGAAVKIVREMLVDPNVDVIPQSRDSFVRALNRYALRQDKQYSLTDCCAMNAMDDAGIRDVLANDHHFAQEGYNVLIK